MVAGQPVRRRIGEIVFDLLPDGGLIGFDGKQIVSTGIADGLGDGGVGGYGVDGDEGLGMIMAAPRGLAVNGDEIGPLRPGLSDPGGEGFPEQGRAGAVDHDVEPAP